MPESNDSNIEAAAAALAADPDPDFDGNIKDESGKVDWKLAARKWERQYEAAKPKLDEYDRLIQASKSDLERAQEQATALQQQATTAERRALIAEVALSKGLPPTLARRLQGDTQEDLEADADELLSQFQATQSRESRTPRPDPSQGSSSSRGSAVTPAQEFAALIQSQTGA